MLLDFTLRTVYFLFYFNNRATFLHLLTNDYAMFPFVNATQQLQSLVLY